LRLAAAALAGGRGGGAPRRGDRPESVRPSSQPQVQISDLLKEGQEIIVQIAKEPLGTKGARITSHVALPGRYLVYMPTISHIGVSRKIGSEEERLRLRSAGKRFAHWRIHRPTAAGLREEFSPTALHFGGSAPAEHEGSAVLRDLVWCSAFATSFRLTSNRCA
jgi:hypothetical protein